jgi:predicted amidohydrolase YtcJ
MEQLFFFNFSGRNLPDYSKKDFDTMLVMNGTILKTGFQLPFPSGPNVKAINLQNATVFAGFSDAHVHFTQTGLTRSGANLDKATRLSEVFDLINEETKTSDMALAFNFQEQSLEENRRPTLAELDKISADKFIWVARKDLHSAILNSKALEWANNFIPGLKHQNGFVSGENYNPISYKLLNEISDSLLLKGMQATEEECLSKGVVCIHALEGSTDSDREAKLAADFFKNNKLEGVVYHQSVDPNFAKKQGWAGFGGCLLVDGSFGTRTAALNEPYADSPESNGNLYLDSAAIQELLQRARTADLQLAVHSIGDRANDLVAASYAWARQKYGAQPPSDRIEHFILPSTRAIRAARESEALVCIQPVFDLFWGGKEGLYSQRLGKERAARCNPFKTMLDLGIPLAGGSDSPVTPIDPILGIHALLNHSNTEERIDLNSALSLFITEPHKFAGKNKTRGHLKTGYKADFICLSEDPFMVSPARLDSLEVTRTFINGNEVWGCHNLNRS